MSEKAESVHLTMAQIVENEIKNERSGVFGYLNNFYCKLPFPGGRDYWDLSKVRGKPAHMDVDKIRRERPIDSVERMEKGMSRAKRLERREQEFGCSKKYQTKTRFEFLDDVKLAIEQAGIDRQELETFVWNLHERDRSVVTTENAQQYLLPIYIKLREMGYTHRDLFTS